MEKDQEFIFMWAMGQLYQNKPIAHLPWNRGREYSTFSEDYADDGSDDFYGDGGGCPPPYVELTDEHLTEVCSELLDSLSEEEESGEEESGEEESGEEESEEQDSEETIEIN